MSKQNPENTIKNIYEKSVRLLNDANSRLSLTKQVLKKTIIRLTLTSHGNDRLIDKAIKDIQVVADNNVDIFKLDKQLDDLFVLINNSDYDYDTPKITGFYKYLRHAFNKYDSSISSDEYLSKVDQLINKRLPDEEIASGVIDVFKDLSETCHGLQSFIFKINHQLSEVEHYIRQSQQDKEDDVARSCALQASVDQSVSEIENEVDSADDINHLKLSVSGRLEGIRIQVEENKQAEEIKEQQSLKKYSKMVNELNQVQKESHSLKEELYESKTRLLIDVLTGVPNRLAYNERIIVEYNRMQRNKTSMCLAIWDIDFFKKVNDTYGHDVGDNVLKVFAKIIQSRVRKVDLFARYGGEEFVLIMPDTSIDNALLLNNKLRTMVEKCNFHFQGTDCPITASVGIAAFEDGDVTEDAFKKADKALYESKNNGRNQCTIYKEPSLYEAEEVSEPETVSET